MNMTLRTLELFTCSDIYVTDSCIDMTKFPLNERGFHYKMIITQDFSKKQPKKPAGID